MHRLARAPPLVRLPTSQAVRFNSSDAPVPEQTRPAPAAKPRIASSWDGISIPSKEEIQSNPNRPRYSSGHTFTPNLSYLRQPAAANSFASALARNIQRSEPNRNSPPRNVRRPAPAPAPVQAVAPAEPAVPFVDTTIAQRKAEREARELRLSEKKARWQAQSQAREAARKEAEGVRQRELQEPGLDVLSATGDSAPGKRKFKSADKPRRVRTPSGVVHPSMSAGKGRAVTPLSASAFRQKPKTKKVRDETMGDDAPEEAALQGPDAPSADISEMFTPTHTMLATLGKRQRQRKLEERIAWALQTFGGNYSQYCPQDGKEYAQTPQELGALRYAMLTYAHRPDISAKQRDTARNVIRFAVGEISALPGGKDVRA